MQADLWCKIDCLQLGNFYAAINCNRIRLLFLLQRRNNCRLILISRSLLKREIKEWLSHQMENNRTYSATTDQPAFAALFDIEQARQADSFDKCYRDIVRLLEELQKASAAISEQA